jgi:hypothetical protein
VLTASPDERRAHAASVGLLRGWSIARTIVEDALLDDGVATAELRAFADGLPSAVDALIEAHDPRRFAGRRALPSALRRLIIHRDERCRACGSARDLHIDHVVPLAAGGTDDPDNLQVLCASCNCAKGGRVVTLAELRALRGLAAGSASDAA